MNEKLRKTIIIICTVVFLCCAAGLAWHYARQYLESRVDESVSGLVVQTSAPTPSPTPEPEASPSPTPEPTPHQVLEKYGELYAQNPDAIGWLKIDGTAIDYVVMQTPQEPDKYLHIDFYGNYSNRGTLYMDEDCDIWASDNLIIYGHHMQSSAMFGDLDLYASEDYWREHPTLRFDTIYEEAEYEIVAAFYARILYKSEEGFRYYQFIDAADEEAFSEYAAFIEENRCYDTGLDISYGDRLITLSTCAYQVENGRFAVVARKIVPEDAPAQADAAGEAEESGDVELTDELVPFSAAPPVPVSASAPEGGRQAFSTNLILLALLLMLSGTGVLALSRKH